MKQYIIELQAVGAAVKAHINSYLLYDSSTASHNYSTNLRPWLESDNLLRVELTASSEANQNDPITFSVKVSNSEGEEGLVCKLDYPLGIAKSEILLLPFDTKDKKLEEGHTLDFKCAQPDLMRVIPWTEGDTIKEADIYSLFSKIQSFFVAADVNSIMDISKERLAFCAELYEVDPEEYATDLRKDLTETFASKPEWRLISNPERQLMIHEFKENRVVRLLDLSGNGALMTRSDEDGVQTGYDLIFCASKDGLIWVM